MKTMLFVVCVVILCSFTTSCGFEVIGLNGPYDNTSSECGEDTWMDDNERPEDANGESGKLDYSIPDVAEAADEDSSDKPDTKPDELVNPEIPDIPDITDTGTDPPDVPDVWPDVPDVKDIHEVKAEVEIVEVIDPCSGVDCNDDNNCTNDFCLQDTGECVHDVIAGCCLADVECADNDVCNGVETCKDNECQQGETLKCNDDNVCTDDSCDSVDGCVYTPNIAPCDDADPCTSDDYCAEDGQCVGKTWCVCFTDADCLDDGNLCNGTYKCQGNFCVIDPATVVNCDDEDPCTKDSCDSDTGECVYDTYAGCCHDNSECDDGNNCDGYEHCCNASNTCSICKIEEPVFCDDGNACTDDACDPTTGKCVYVPNTEPCNDSDPCTKNDTCQNKVCVGELVPCECQSTTDCKKLEDGNLCNGTLVCVQMLCVVDPATTINCTDNDLCTDDSCNPITGQCSHSQIDCTDNSPYTGDWCDPAVGCIHEPLECVWDMECGDDNACTDDTCQYGKCTHESNAAPCYDGDLCTTGDTCFNGVCQPGTPVLCNDNNDCTADGCVPAVGCVLFNLPNGTTCDDKDACTTSDTCQTGKCKGGPAPECDDDNVCTTDSCDPTTGCTNTPSNEGQKCGDANVCNGAETCANGLCAPGTPLNCDDGKECTADGCVPEIGCINTQIPGCCVADKDCDNVLNDKDNCPDTPNADQADMDKDSIGDVCDGVNTCNLSAGGIPSVFSEHNPVCISGCFVGNQVVCIKCISMNNTCIADADGTSGSICQGDCNDSWYGQAYECWPGGQPPPQCKLPWTPQ